MREKKSGQIFAVWILSAILLISVCLPPGAARAAEQAGSIEVQLPADSENVELSLYMIATYQNGVYRFTTDFADSGLEIIQDFNDAQKVEAAVRKLTAFVQDRGLSGIAAKPDSKGIVKFTGLVPALYMVVQSDGEKDRHIQTSLVPIPCLEEGGAVTYDAVIFPKYTDARYSITVEKALVDLGGIPVFARDGVFYVALFSDAEHTKRVSQVLPVRFHGESSGSVTFENLMQGVTYFVGETDEFGNYIESEMTGEGNRSYFFPFYPDDTSVAVDEETGETTYFFENVFNSFPDGFYHKAEVTVTKKVLKGTENYPIDEVYYCALFRDKECTDRMGDVTELAMEGGSETSVTIPVELDGSTDTVFTCYIRETDENGIPLENSKGPGFTVQQDKEKVMLSWQDNEAEVVITNTYEDGNPSPDPSMTPTPGITETPDATPGGNSPQETHQGPRTGDHTNAALYVILLLSAAAAGGTALVRKQKKQ